MEASETVHGKSEGKEEQKGVVSLLMRLIGVV